MLTLISLIVGFLTLLVPLTILRDILAYTRNKRTYSFTGVDDLKSHYTGTLGKAIAVFFIITLLFNWTVLSILVDIIVSVMVTFAIFYLSAQQLDRLNPKYSYKLINSAYALTVLYFTAFLSLAILLSVGHDFYLVGYLFLLLIPYVLILILVSLLSSVSGKPRFFKSGKSTSKVQHYRQAGLSDSEIEHFQDEMRTVRDYIYQIDEEMNKTAKLRAIDVKYNTVKISQQFFADIVKEPQRIAEAGNVIYRTIPSLADITSKYNEINSHIAKTKQTYLILEKSAQTIEALSQALVDEYLAFHRSTFNDLDDEINFAEKNVYVNVDWDEFEDKENEHE